jgi:coenzyme F420-reducing hydrogenase delta subunit/Pyruvate/2-oxoacid:ferredoxin oxidoreductase delta subunit
MGADAADVTGMKAWPFKKQAFVWSIGSSGRRVADLLGELSVPVVLFEYGTEEWVDDPVGQAEEARSRIRVVRGEEILRVEGHFGQFRIWVQEKGGAVTDWEAGFLLVVRDEASTERQGNEVCVPGVSAHTAADLETLASRGGNNDLPEVIGVWLDPIEGLPDRAWAERALRALSSLKTEGRPECYVLSRHVPLWGLEGQALYDELRGKGVHFLRLGEEEPNVKTAEGKVEVALRDQTIPDQTTILRLDRLFVVGQPSPTPGTGEVAGRVGDPLDKEGFLQKDNVHLYPSRSFRRGIYYLGSCKGEQSAEELAEEVGALLPELLGPVSTGEIQAEGGVRIDKGHCVSCLTCYRVCPHHALDISQGPVPVPIDPACYGCGLCAALCPGNAIELVQRPARQILGELDDPDEGSRASSANGLFCCSRLGLGAGGCGVFDSFKDLPGTSVIEVPCACSVSEEMLLAALLKGMERVLVVGCHPDNCVSQKGSEVAEKRTRRVARYLAAAGRDPAECVRFLSVAPNEVHRLKRELDALDEVVSGGRVP